MAPHIPLVSHRQLGQYDHPAEQRRLRHRRNKQKQRTPWPAFLLGFLVVICMVSAALIIRVSIDHSAVNRPPYKRPDVLLALVSGVSNLCLTGLLAVGVAISWWRAASRGTDLQSLHAIWECGTGRSLSTALSSGLQTRMVLLAAALVVLSRFASAPLLQRASELKSVDQVTPIAMSVDLVEQIPDGVMGIRDNDTYIGVNGSVISKPVVTTAFQSWYYAMPINNTSFNRTTTHANQDQEKYRCPENSTCKIRVKGAGLGIGCWSKREDINLLDPRNFLNSSVENSTVFSTKLLPTENGTLSFQAIHIGDITPDCIGRKITEHCEIWPATVEYSVSITELGMRLNFSSPADRRIANYTSKGDLLSNDISSNIGPMLGVYNTFRQLFTINITLLDSFQTSNGGSYSRLFSNYSAPEAKNCGLTYRDPKEFMLNSMRSFVFRVARSISNDNSTQVAQGTKTTPATVYSANYDYLIAALTIIAAALLSAMSLVWGWWELERYVTLSPLETAKAFDAPILQSCQGPGAEGILDTGGSKKVRYDGGRMWDLDGIPLVSRGLDEEPQLTPEDGTFLADWRAEGLERGWDTGYTGRSDHR